jgi:hypothetical protein
MILNKNKYKFAQFGVQITKQKGNTNIELDEKFAEKNIDLFWCVVSSFMAISNTRKINLIRGENLRPNNIPEIKYKNSIYARIEAPTFMVKGDAENILAIYDWINGTKTKETILKEDFKITYGDISEEDVQYNFINSFKEVDIDNQVSFILNYINNKIKEKNIIVKKQLKIFKIKAYKKLVKQRIFKSKMKKVLEEPKTQFTQMKEINKHKEKNL